ncbi:MAG: hypothetical protein PF501_01495 [Salinisphaera sp.]|jgi:hypothetical protein|nr:hypothetical protein [Salinisphaera sp.]
MPETDLVLEQLRYIRDDLKARADRTDLRLTNMEQTLGQLYTMAGSDRATANSLGRRVDRIERPLELRDGA